MQKRLDPAWDQFVTAIRPCNDRTVVITDYHEARTHLSLAKDAPTPRRAQAITDGDVIAFPEVGGLHHRYERRADGSFVGVAWDVTSETLGIRTALLAAPSGDRFKTIKTVTATDGSPPGSSVTGGENTSSAIAGILAKDTGANPRRKVAGSSGSPWGASRIID